MAQPLAVSTLYLQAQCLGYALPAAEMQGGVDGAGTACELVAAAVPLRAIEEGPEPSGPPFIGCQTPNLCRERVIVCNYPECLKGRG